MTRSLWRTKVTDTCRQDHKLGMQILLGHANIEIAVRSHGFELGEVLS
jgi:hypothetical protein